MIYQGDCLEILPTLDAESVDSIVTDPPYGLSFMGKDWDHGVPGVPFWKAILRVAKPGAFLLAFGGTRTFHRLAVAIEDAGWEIRDCLMWIYGSGFPKSLDVSKAIDKAAGATRTIFGVDQSKLRPNRVNRGLVNSAGGSGFHTDNGATVTSPATDAARQWEGWGTALKPAVEYIICAQKPLTLQGLCGKLAQNIGGAICQLPSLAKDAENSLMSNQREHEGESSFVLWSAVEKCNTLEDLFDLMDTLPLELEIPSSLNTGLSWLNTLGVALQTERMFTTETAIGLTTDLKTLNSLPSMTTPETIIPVLTKQHGTESSALIVESIFNVVNAKLASILTPSAPGLVTSLDGSSALRPNWRPIIVARKPINGTVAANVLKYGTGGLNIDGCRVETEDTYHYNRKGGNNGAVSWKGLNCEVPASSHSQGRWPANLIHDGSEEVVGLFPQTTSGKTSNKETAPSIFGKRIMMAQEGSSGSAARFFYCAKSSKADREGSTHPTMKPTSLMRYLCRLVTPPGGIVLDPFMGSGSTGKAAGLEGFEFIGIELNPEYVQIAERRISGTQTQQLDYEARVEAAFAKVLNERSNSKRR